MRVALAQLLTGLTCLLTSAKSVSQGNVQYWKRLVGPSVSVQCCFNSQFVIKDVCPLYLSLSSELPVIRGEH